MAIVSRFFKDPGQSFFLFGPRGTGKSTWVRMYFPEALLVDLLRPEVWRTYAARPERLKELVDGNPEKQWVIVDEVQKVPELLDVVHSLIEEKRGLQFILTGSSARKIKHSGVDLLAGRALLRTMHPFMAAELGSSFHLEDTLRNGSIPLVVTSTMPEEVLKGYTDLYIQEEVRMEGLVRKLGHFTRFLEAISFSHGSVLNISNVARECEVHRRSVDEYISILEDLHLAFRVPVFTKRARRAVISHPKFYLVDAGVFRSLRPRGFLDRTEEIEGLALEGLVMQHLQAWNAYRGECNCIYFWRTRGGTEVDIIVYGDDGLTAIEVKNSRRIHGSDLRSLQAFREDYPECRVMLLYRGDNRIRKKSILCMPCEEFLLNLRPDQTLPE